MRHAFPLILIIALALAAGGCGSFTGQAGFVPPASLTPSVEAGPFPASATPAPISEPTNTPLPGATQTVTPISGFDTDGAVQTVLDYFDAINQREYLRAYQYWDKAGAASGQGFDQFTQGYTNTVQVTVQLGEPEGQRGYTTPAARIPVTLTAVVNDPASLPLGQRVQHYRGTYTLQLSAVNSTTTAWRIVSASIDEISGLAQPAVDVADPLTLLRSYIEAINAHQYARAYTYWDNLGRASQQTYTEFHQGFATTVHVSIDIGTDQPQGAAGSVYDDVPVVIVAAQTDGTAKTFCGTYTLRRLNVPPFDQLGWRIEGAKIGLTSAVQSETAEAQRLLTDCAQ